MVKLLTLSLLFILFACQTESRNPQDTQNPLKQVELLTPAGDKINTRIVVTPEDQQQGLSGVKAEDFAENEGMLFYYMEEDEKHFWMPDTYFALDIFYLDKDLKILDVVRNLPFYIGRANPNLIPKARPVWCRHTLEMKASSEISKRLKVGDVLKWNGKYSLIEMQERVKAKLSH
jgi:uncharacterized membrane protein (UPF0127 family)